MASNERACPCSDAHRRLMDLHEDIHRVIEAYPDENEFRRCLNTAIQDSRGVTFLLQKRKARWPNFGDWYGEWQNAARSNSILAWGVNSRNRIVKEEDLRTLSQAIISYYGERLQESESVMTVPSYMSVEDMLAVFANLAKEKPRDRRGWIRVQRRWVDDKLPDYELVAALREIYANVAQIIRRAHEESGVAHCLAPSIGRACVTAAMRSELTCLGEGDPVPSGMIDVTTGKLMRFAVGNVEYDENLAEVGFERYGLMPVRGVDAIEHVSSRMELSKRFLEADGYAGPMLFLHRGTAEMRVHPIAFDRDEPRELKLAATIELNGAWQFDGAVFASETWLTTEEGRGSLLGLTAEELLPSNEELFNADDFGNRDEALIVVGVAADGRSLVQTLPFGRTEAGIVYGDMMVDRSREAIPSFLRPIWRTWQHWKRTSTPL